MNLKKKQKIFQFSGRLFALPFATGFGIGFIPPFPGTLGALEGILLYLLTKNFTFINHLIILIAITLVGLISSHYASQSLKKEDPDEVVIDEIAGAYLACLGKGTFWELTLSFIFFRIIDINKPFPLRRVEKLKGGLGIMIDDLLAGAITNLLILILAKLL